MQYKTFFKCFSTEKSLTFFISHRNLKIQTTTFPEGSKKFQMGKKNLVVAEVARQTLRLCVL